jgi:hypothetical protein
MAYELVVYAVGEESEEARPVLRQTVPGTANGWTPSLESCLDRGGQYAWSVRATGGKEASEWSSPSLFEVASGPSQAQFEEAVAVVRAYIAERHETTVEVSAEIEDRSQSQDRQSTEANSPTPTGVSPPTVLSVDGDVHATSFTGDGRFLTGLATDGELTKVTRCLAKSGHRYLDLGDGTVLDCNTELIWLKDASCLSGTWDVINDTSIFTKVTDLNSGTDFGCAEYAAGTYTDWEVPAMVSMCGLWDGSCIGTSCCTASQGIVDTGFTNPALGNAAGDGQWMAGDAFVGVLASHYWSATESDDNDAWLVNLFTGNIFDLGKGFGRRLWPVRGGQ